MQTKRRTPEGIEREEQKKEGGVHGDDQRSDDSFFPLSGCLLSCGMMMAEGRRRVKDRDKYKAKKPRKNLHYTVALRSTGVSYKVVVVVVCRRGGVTELAGTVV